MAPSPFLFTMPVCTSEEKGQDLLLHNVGVLLGGGRTGLPPRTVGVLLVPLTVENDELIYVPSLTRVACRGQSSSLSEIMQIVTSAVWWFLLFNTGLCQVLDCIVYAQSGCVLDIKLGHISPSQFFRSDIIIGCFDVAFKVTVQKTYVWSLGLSDLMTPYRWCYSMPCVNSPLVVQYFWVHSFSCQATAPSTTLTSAYGLGGTSALRAVPWLHEHPDRFVVKPMGHGGTCLSTVFLRKALTSLVVSSSTNPVQLRLIPSI